MGDVSNVCGGGCFVAGDADEDHNDHVDNDIDGKNDAWFFNFNCTYNKIFIICDIFKANLASLSVTTCKWFL